MQQRDDSVLAILRGAADGIERLIAIDRLRGAEAIHHRLPNQFSHLQRLGHQHRRLVGEANVLQIALGIEPRRRRLDEVRQEAIAIAAVADVFADDRRLGVIEHDEILAAVLHRL